MMMMKCMRCLTSWYQKVVPSDSLTNSSCARFLSHLINGEGKTIPFCSICTLQLRQQCCKMGAYFGLLKLSHCA